ncbi:Similar to X-element\ORF2: Probable RNA-directed DNA polymerase from transposon X-element (Drosophila melanogaster) [Cotesia congregata]|uniref:Similar to X-element\ORF2: Probable RNA-directed DNA polymerase from transposon X-element (Drosophila melanogaster) n=1 Tax=Cotesia congregata TaxID=51543 RepID=A0A8J2H6U1_COTCN|nr:Similar to X-element\ORF2: Probable RNA-directed DNA polymerase from transposon X-element (Drosophila melanogaster) [Cotesia congregata]
MNLVRDHDIILLTETWLKPEEPFYINNYNIIRKDRQDSNGGGLAIAVKTNISFEVLSDFLEIEDQIDTLAIKINTNQGPIIFATTNIDWKAFEDILTQKAEANSALAEPTTEAYDEFIKIIKDPLLEATKPGNKAHNNSGKQNHTQPQRDNSAVRKIRTPAPWWNDDCAAVLEERKAALQIMKRQLTVESYAKYKQAEAKAKQTFYQTKKKAWQEFTETLNGTTPISVIWKKFKAFKNRRLTSPHALPRQELSAEPKKQDFIKTYSLPATDDFPETPITLTELNSAINRSKSGSSPGLDQISHEIIKRLPESLKTRLLDYYNNFIKRSKYPLAWTEHLVYLLPKGDTGKFRPITLAPCFLKVMEKIVVDRTTWWLEHNNKIPDTQFGFRTGKSTADNLAVVVGDIYTGLAAGEFIITAFLDIKGAFDHVNPDILLQILVNTGIPTAYCLFFYYLIKQRKLYFVTNNGLTEPQLVNSGAGQGLVSAPLLFTLYTADGGKHIHSSSKIAEFADDKAIRCRNKNLQYAIDALQASLDSYSAYLEKLNLQLSPEKTKIIIFTHNDYNPRDISFTIKDVTVKPTTSAKFLGITLDQKLTFEDHYSNILTKINKVFPLIKSLCGTKWGAAPATLLNIYRALIRTKIEYGSHIMNAISSKLFSKLEKVQNKAIRTSMGLRISTPINSMMAEGGEIPLKIRLKDLSDRYTLKSLSTTNNPVINTLRTLDECLTQNKSKQYIYKRFPAISSYHDTIPQHDIIYQSIAHPRYTHTYSIFQHPLNIDLTNVATLTNMSQRDTIETFEKMTNEKYKNLTQVYTDASKSPDEPHVGVAIYNATLNTQLTFKINQQASATTAEALAILKAVEVALEMQEGTIRAFEFPSIKKKKHIIIQMVD